MEYKTPVLFIKISLIFSVTITTLNAYAAQTNFLNLCNVVLKKNQAVCKKIQTKLFKDDLTSPLIPFTVDQVSAPKMDIDSKIQFIVFNDPNYLSAVAYCYFVFRQWINPDQISPDALGTASSGFSILKESIREYHRWLDYESEGKNCKKLVQTESGIPVVDLKATLKESLALIALNPYASIKNHGANLPAIEKDFIATLNHERIHSYQASCPTLEAWSRKEWQKLTIEEKNQYQKKYSSYNWNDLSVAGREYIAFKYESKPQTALNQKGICKL